MGTDDKPTDPQDNDNNDNSDSEEEISQKDKDQLKMSIEAPTTDGSNEDKDMEIAKAIIEKSSGIEIKVHNPQEKKGGAFSKNYFTYEISGKDKNGSISVQRRYKEFDALRERLKLNWPGIFIPALPEKKLDKNNNKIIKEREIFLNHFMKKCAKMDHIFYSEEMQIFLRSTGSSDELLKNLTTMAPKTASQLCAQYTSLFPEFDRAVTKETQEIIAKKIKDLKVPLDEVFQMRMQLKKMDVYRSELKHLRGEFVKYMAKDAIIKIKEETEVQKIKDLVRDYGDLEKKDDITTLKSKLKTLQFDLSSFQAINQDLSIIFKLIGQNQGLVNETIKEINTLKSSDKEVVSDGLFKKVNREDKIKELQGKQDKAQDELNASQKLNDLVLTMLEKQEIPLILYVKNMGLALGMAELTKRRTECLRKEEETLKNLSDCYSKRAF